MTTPKHADTLKRLKKVEGQIKGLQRMVDDGRYCIDILQQLTAARRALDQVGMAIMRRHIDSCVSEAIRSKHGAGKVTELMQAVDRFIR